MTPSIGLKLKSMQLKLPVCRQQQMDSSQRKTGMDKKLKTQTVGVMAILTKMEMFGFLLVKAQQFIMARIGMFSSRAAATKTSVQEEKY